MPRRVKSWYLNLETWFYIEMTTTFTTGSNPSGHNNISIKMNLNLQKETSFPVNTYFPNVPNEARTPAQFVVS